MKTIILLIGTCILGCQMQASFVLSSSPAVGNNPYSVAAADMNGDGKVDLICANVADNSLSVLTNDGSGGFVTMATYAVGDGPRSVAVADVNGDGKVDLICANAAGNSLSVLTNNGSGGFVLSDTYSGINSPGWVTAADVNGDGKVDLVCVGYYGQLYVLTNNGSGKFVIEYSTTLSGHLYSVATADVNGDGLVDLVCANNGNNIFVLTNNANVGFGLSATYALGTGTASVTLADVNGDGKVDLISADTGGNTLSVLTNNGSGGFVLNATYTVGNAPVSVKAADVNGDGKMDLICGNYSDNTVSVLTNNGSGGFVSAGTYAVGSGPESIAVADVNGDGKLDLISANSVGNTLSVLTNGIPFPPATIPIITIQPAGISNLVGSTATFSVGVTAATGPLLFNYQWRLNGTNLPAATNNPLVLLNLTLNQAGSYDVVVSDSAGSVTSSPAMLAFLFPPTITTQPVPQIVAAGTPVTLSVTVTGTPTFYYQWVDSLGTISGATNASYSLNPAQTNNWDNYFVIVTNAYGAVTSTVTPLVVYGPVTISVQPMSQAVPLGATTSFTVMADGFPAPVYQWTLNGTNIAGATANTLTVTNVDLTNTGYYQALINNGYDTNNSYLATLNISPSFVTPFAGATTVWGTSATLAVGAVGSGQLGYQWYQNGMAIAGATNTTLNFASIQFTNAGLYSVVVSSQYGTITNAAYEVVVNPAGVTIGFYPGLTISGATGYSYIIQSTTNLADPNAWVTLTNLTLTQPVQLFIDTTVDASSPFNPMTFYKVLPGQ